MEVHLDAASGCVCFQRALRAVGIRVHVEFCFARKRPASGRSSRTKLTDQFDDHLVWSNIFIVCRNAAVVSYQRFWNETV